MTHISSLISSDSRNVYERLRRIECYKVLESYGIPYPAGASKEKMIQIMEGSGIDPRKPGPNGGGVKFIPITVTDEDGKQRIEMYPEEKPHATANKAINYDIEIARIAKESEAEEARLAVKDDKIAELEQQIQILMEKFGGAETTSEPVFDEAMEVEELRALAKERGIKVHHKAGKKKLIEALSHGENTP